MEKYFKVSLSIFIFLFFLVLLTQTADAAAHSVGANVKFLDGTVYALMKDDTRRPFTSAAAFLSYSYNNWETVVPSNQDDLDIPIGDYIPPRDGSIICSDRGEDKSTCYFISDGKKYGFASELIFKDLGFNFSNAEIGDVSWLPTGDSIINSSVMPHLPGTLICDPQYLSATDQGIMLVTAYGLARVPQISILKSWGYTSANVVPANKADKEKQVKDTLSYRENGVLSIISGIVAANFAAQAFLQNSPQDVSVAPGSAYVDIFKATLKAPDTKPIGIKRLIFILSGNVPLALLTNLQIIYGNTIMPLPPVFTNGSESHIVVVDIPKAYYLKTGSGSDVIVKVDISPQTAGYNLTVQLVQIDLIDALGASDTKTTLLGLPVLGNQINFDNGRIPITPTVSNGESMAFITPLEKDSWRLADIRQIASALELYFNDYNSYPPFLSVLAPTYIGALPNAPTPEDGSCTPVQNSYNYSYIDANHYSLAFCLGGQTSNYSPGVRVLTEKGIK